MKNDPWTCNLCGSQDVEQEFSTMLPMNPKFEFYGMEVKHALCQYGMDFYWCNDCNTQVDPVRDSENPLT